MSRQLSHGVAEVVYAALVGNCGQSIEFLVGGGVGSSRIELLVGGGIGSSRIELLVGGGVGSSRIEWRSEVLSHRVIGWRWSRQLSHRVEVGDGVGSSRIEWRSEVE